MKYICVIIVLAILCIAITGCGVKQDKVKYGVFIGVDPEDMDILYEYSVVVIDASYFTKADINNLHEKGIVVYSYLNIGTIETFREDYSKYQHCVLGAYEDWPDEYWVDASQAAWQEHISELAESLIEKDIDGFFLDNTDVYYEYNNQGIFDGLIAIINGLEQYQKDVIVNGGDTFVTDTILEPEYPMIQISGVNQECVFSNIDFEEDTFVEQDPESSQYYQNYLEQCSATDLTVYITEYINNANEALTKTIDDYCHKHNFIYYISPTKDLIG